MKPTPSSQVVVLAALALVAVASSAHAQSVLSGPVVNVGGTATIDIEQTGPARLGTLANPVSLSGTGTENLSLTVVQVGSYGASHGASEINASVVGSAASSTVILKQETAAQAAVSDVWAKIALGTTTAGTTQNITLKQQGDGGRATLLIDSGSRATVHWTQSVADVGTLQSTDGSDLSAYLVQNGTAGSGSLLNITNSGASNAYGTVGTPMTLGALSTLTITNTGTHNSYAVNAAAGSTVGITNTGNANTYNIATQQAGDALALGINGSNNTFTFNFDAYKQVDWTVGAAAPVNSGNFQVGSASESWYVYDTTSNNIAAAANATVTKR
ncbi:hypothetical protein [Polaromonas sp.]|uniref:hypothetical protein n=1 Tax=Polaromonas sp. TaxID=1869339 RepID=UPI0013B9D6A3|nr:hypothetical protein [Polaromonas sp.]NDP64171.1 hypothetical protein [Polaromonas sp.]